MKKLRVVLVCIGLVVIQLNALAQLDTLFKINAASFDSAGFVMYSPQSTQPWEPWEIYQETHEDADNGFTLLEIVEDPMLHFSHVRFQQTYKGLPIEAAVWKEHAKDGYLVYSNGMLVSEMQGNPTPVAFESEALAQVLQQYPENTFAWMLDEWEVQVQEDLQDSTATNYPSGELLWALDNYSNMKYLIPASRFRLAWRFEVLSVTPSFYKAFFVDAHTGEVFRQDDLNCYNGTGDTWFHGRQSIDTKWTGNVNKYILWADDNGRNIHTKHHYNIGAWGLGTNYKNPDTTWGLSDIEGTSTHWFASESWDYFSSPPFNLNIDSLFDHKELRIWVDIDTIPSGGSYSKKTSTGFQMLIMDVDDEKAIDIVGHEFTHRIQDHRGLANKKEPGALKESFGDIFGALIEGRTEGTMNWVHGGDPGNVPTRNLMAPKTDGLHPLSSQCDSAIGQPNTYLGEFWYADSICDRGGVHCNEGVQNYWFYLLSEGGSGTNDSLDSYSIQGIGSDKAARITYFSMMHNLSNGDGYLQARVGAIQAAQLLFGSCSFEEIQTTNAWFAVGVGAPSSCPVAISPAIGHMNEISKVFPNPSSGSFSIRFADSKERTLEVSTVWGQILKRFTLRPSDNIELDLHEFPSGMYLVNVHSKVGTSTLKLIKQ